MFSKLGLPEACSRSHGSQFGF